MDSGDPVKNYTTGRCGHLIFHLDPHDKCMDCRKSKCDFHENCCDLCGSLSDSIIRTLRRLYLKNKRPILQISPSPSQSRCSSKVRDTPIAELMSSPKPSKKAKCSKPTGKKSAFKAHKSDCVSTANTTATLTEKQVDHVEESVPHVVELSGAMCTNSVDSVNVAINDITGYVHSNATGGVSVVSPQSQDVLSTDMQRQMRFSESIPVTVRNQGIQHCVTAANASHMPCSTDTSRVHPSCKLPWTVSAIPIREDNRNSVCDIDDEVSPASSSGRVMSVAQTHNLRTTEHQIHTDIHEVSPASASGRIMSVAQTHNLRRQCHINEHKAPCKSAQDAQGKPLSINEKIPMRARTVSRQPRGLPSSEGGIQTAQSHHHGPTNRQYTTYGAGHRERDYYVSSKLQPVPDIMSPRYEDVSENENQIRYRRKRTRYSSSSDTDSQVWHNPKKRRYSEIRDGMETVKDRKQESAHNVYEHSDNSADNQVLTVTEYNNSTNKFIASITECEGGMQKNSESSNVGGMFDNILGESSKATEIYLLPASNTTKYMMNHFNTLLRGHTVKERKGMAWTEEELQDIPKVSETSKSTGLFTKVDSKIVKKSVAFAMFDQPDMFKDRIHSRNMYEDRQLRDLETDTCSTIASNNRLELATQSAINLAIASVSEEEYDMRLKEELTPLLDAINESVRKSAYHLQKQYTNLRLLRRDLRLKEYKESTRANLRTMPVDSEEVIIGQRGVASTLAQEEPIKELMIEKGQTHPFRTRQTNSVASNNSRSAGFVPFRKPTWNHKAAFKNYDYTGFKPRIAGEHQSYMSAMKSQGINEVDQFHRRRTMRPTQGARTVRQQRGNTGSIRF